MPSIQVDKNLTEAAARTATVKYLTDTLRNLPVDVSLSRNNPRNARASFGDANTIPCVDDDTVKDSPYNVNTLYWVVGVHGNEALDKFTDAWKKLGWPTQASDEGTTKTVRARTPDDYALKVTVNKNGSVGVSVSTPCFPHNAVGGDPVPSDIPHP